MTIETSREQTEIQYRPTKPGTIYKSNIEATYEQPKAPNDTLARCFVNRVRELGDQVAHRKKRYGIWIEYNWNDLYDHVSNFFHGLVSLGLEANDVVVIIGDNDPEMYWTQIAVHSNRSQTCCVFSDALPEPDLLFVVKHTEAKFIVAHDQEQVDKALEIKAKIPSVKRVIYWEERGMWSYDDPWLASFKAVEELGQEHMKQDPGLYEETVAKTEPSDMTILSMTSGTTGLPKFAMGTNQQQLTGYAINYDYIRVTSDDNWLSFSPMAWATEQAFGYVPHLRYGMTINFPESPETVPNDLREVAPIGLLFPSRLWENLSSTIRFRINDSTWLNRKLYEWFMPLAYRVIDLRDAGQEIPWHLRFLRWIGEFAVFEPLRDKVGLTRARNVLTAGALLSPDIVRFYAALGIELRQLYASTETFCAVHLPGRVKLETVGELVPGIEVKIAEDQEILVRTDARFKGYYRAPEKTSEAIDEEGWYYTGDAGYMREDGHLVYLERVKDMIELANGHTFSPQFIEGRLKFSPYIQDIMTIGGLDMDYVTAIIVINFENVSRWAEKRGLTFTTFVDLSQKPQVYDLVKQDVLRVNESLPPEGRLKKFVILHKEFDADEGELTRTRKLKRRTLHLKYADILEALYSNANDVSIHAEVKYRDGREAVIETKLQVCHVN